MGEMSDDFEVSTDTAASRRAERYPRPFLRTTPGGSWRNTEQHEYIHYAAHPHRCFCGESENAEVHQRFKRAAARFTQHPYLHDGTTSANCSTCGLRKQSPSHTNVGKPPTTGDSGKDSRVAKWRARLDYATPGSQAERTALSMLRTFTKEYPDLEVWLAQHTGRHLIEQSEAITVAESLEPIRYRSYHNPRTRAIDVYPPASSFWDKVMKAASNNLTTNPVKEAEELMNTNQNPDDMEKAALRLATLAQEIREHDEREPQGDEPVITWKHTFENGTTAIEPRVYTYVAVKLDGGWSVTGDKQAGCAHTWRDFLSRDWAQEITTGDFLICTEWTHAQA